MATNKTVRKIRYRNRLQEQPDKGLGGASSENESLLVGFFTGAVFMGMLIWGIALWTARTQPL